VSDDTAIDRASVRHAYEQVADALATASGRVLANPSGTPSALSHDFQRSSSSVPTDWPRTDSSMTSCSSVPALS
jgi:hypothetical protein